MRASLSLLLATAIGLSSCRSDNRALDGLHQQFGQLRSAALSCIATSDNFRGEEAKMTYPFHDRHVENIEAIARGREIAARGEVACTTVSSALNKASRQAESEGLRTLLSSCEERFSALADRWLEASAPPRGRSGTFDVSTPTVGASTCWAALSGRISALG